MNKLSILSVGFLGTLGGVALISEVSAGTMASPGYAIPLSDVSCFQVATGAIRNNCAGTKTWEVSDTASVVGNHTITITGFRPGGGTLLCGACATDKAGFASNCPAIFQPSVINTDTQFTLGVVNVPSFGGIIAFCDLSQGAWYDSVNGF